MFYRFNCGTFIEADNFEEAKATFIDQITTEKENPKSWNKCTCLGFDYRSDCPEHWANEVPFNSENIPYYGEN